MSNAASAGAVPNGKKKLIIIAAAAAVLLGGGAAALLLKKNASGDDDGPAPAAERAPVNKKAARHNASQTPVFAPLEPFTVNLADTDSERFAQVGVTLELDEPGTADAVKTFMPVIRNNILLVLAHKTSTEVLAPEGKSRLAGEIARATSRALGVEVDEPDDEADDENRKGKKKRRRVEPALPVVAVHFSNFIVQ
jgi:flagellar FliL protein